MKYIKHFEKLKEDTYKSASTKLKELAGRYGPSSAHLSRAVELDRWVDIKKYHNLGTFNLRYNGKINGIHHSSEIFPFYLTGVHFCAASFFESCVGIKESSDYGLSAACCFYNYKIDVKNIVAFIINFNIIWDDDKFYVDKMKVEGSDTNFFSDRQSAFKFKKFLVDSNDWLPKENEENEDLDIKNQFMLHSTAEDYQKVIDSIRNISVNTLYH